MIDTKTRAKIKGYVEGFLQHTVEQILSRQRDRQAKLQTGRKDTSPAHKPFHRALLPEGIRRISEFERSFSTALGSTFEEAGKLIAAATHQTAIRGHKISGRVSAKAIGLIEAIVESNKQNGSTKPYLEFVRQVVDAAAEDGGEIRPVTSDLYVKTHSGEEWYFEIKSPMPNKGQCLEATSRLLHICAIRHEQYPKLRTHFAMGYNPYGEDKSDYKWSFAVRHMDMKNQVVIGREFWDLLGGEDTYDDLLSIYNEVGREKAKYLLDKLMLNY